MSNNTNNNVPYSPRIQSSAARGVILPRDTGHVHSCTISTPSGAYSPATISALKNYRTHSNRCFRSGTYLHLGELKHVRVKCSAE